jgi:hypothetical protein
MEKAEAKPNCPLGVRPEGTPRASTPACCAANSKRPLDDGPRAARLNGGVGLQIPVAASHLLASPGSHTPAPLNFWFLTISELGAHATSLRRISIGRAQPIGDRAWFRTVRGGG